MLSLGTLLPDFTLIDAVTGSPFSPNDFENRRALLVMFICNHCPFVKHVMPELGRLAADYEPQGVGIVAINSNDIDAYPADAPDEMRALALAEGWTFPFLLDETQEIATVFRAACTPDFFLFDDSRALVYRGQLDGSRPSNDVPVTGADLRAALDALLGGYTVPSDQQPSIGCNIKWKPENAPAYFARPGT
jgi:thiol-disulfide isomerase/thioredoxin